MAAECLYKPGDKVVISPDVIPNIYGDDIEVISICDSYYKMGKLEKWPVDTDCPLIVHARAVSKKQNFFCTPNYLIKV
jgi:hypothetical protein